MTTERAFLGMSNVATNVSVDGDTLFLPVDDDEWVELINRVRLHYEEGYRKMWERLDEIRMRERRLRESGFFKGRKTREEDLKFLKLHGNFTPYDIYTSKTYYTLIVLEKLLHNQRVERNMVIKIITSERDDYSEFMFREGWWLAEETISMIDYSPSTNKPNMALKMGKAIARSILANDYQYPTTRENLGQYIKEESDFWDRNHVRNI